MIFVILGSQKFQFTRVLKYIDELINNGIIEDTVFCQSGYTSYRPKYFTVKPFLDKEEFLHKISESKLIITHGGTGAIINCLIKNKKVIAIPRNSKYGEHVDNHQYEIVGVFVEMNHILSATSYEELEIKIKEVDSFLPVRFKSNNDRFLISLEQIINDKL